MCQNDRVGYNHFLIIKTGKIMGLSNVNEQCSDEGLRRRNNNLIETPAVREITDFIHETFAGDGVEVVTQGHRSLTVELPLECHDFGSLCAGVEQGWGARVDVHANDSPGLGPRATIWLPRDVDQRPNDVTSGGVLSYALFRFLLVLLCLGLVASTMISATASEMMCSFSELLGHHLDSCLSSVHAGSDQL